MLLYIFQTRTKESEHLHNTYLSALCETYAVSHLQKVESDCLRPPPLSYYTVLIHLRFSSLLQLNRLLSSYNSFCFHRPPTATLNINLMWFDTDSMSSHYQHILLIRTLAKSQTKNSSSKSHLQPGSCCVHPRHLWTPGRTIPCLLHECSRTLSERRLCSDFWCHRSDTPATCHQQGRLWTSIGAGIGESKEFGTQNHKQIEFNIIKKIKPISGHYTLQCSLTSTLYSASSVRIWAENSSPSMCACTRECSSPDKSRT